MTLWKFRSLFQAHLNRAEVWDAFPTVISSKVVATLCYYQGLRTILCVISTHKFAQAKKPPKGHWHSRSIDCVIDSSCTILLSLHLDFLVICMLCTVYSQNKHQIVFRTLIIQTNSSYTNKRAPHSSERQVLLNFRISHIQASSLHSKDLFVRKLRMSRP